MTSKYECDKCDKQENDINCSNCNKKYCKDCFRDTIMKMIIYEEEICCMKRCECNTILLIKFSYFEEKEDRKIIFERHTNYVDKTKGLYHIKEQIKEQTNILKKELKNKLKMTLSEIIETYEKMKRKTIKMSELKVLISDIDKM